ncbi:MAG: SAP domain-containing protein [Deltaproteobacteria bacterium]|nr:SAP domain-containing protein [Deltaproteobacteria bacterium]
MRLADLLAETSVEDLDRLAHDHARADDELARPQLLATIEGVLRSHRFLQEFLVNLQPPAFAILTVLLDAPDYRFATREFREAVVAETDRLCQAIDNHEVLDRDDQIRVYRRVLYQARSNDTLIDPAEAAILGVLRQELKIAQVEHFLIEHHADLREFWRRDAAFIRELHALRSAGIVYEREGFTLLPDDLARGIRQVLGLDMSRPDARRLFGYLSNLELHEALSAIRVSTSGAKDERIERLIANMAQPRVVVRLLGVGRLREVCKEIGAAVSGSKDELVDRIVAHVAADRDIVPAPEPPAAIQEARRLSEERFGMLFSKLRGHELAAILSELELRRWGTKESQVRTLWEAHRSEETLLGALSSADLEAFLRRLGLRSNGSKGDRSQRVIEHFAGASLDDLRETPAVAVVGGGEGGDPTT